MGLKSKMMMKTVILILVLKRMKAMMKMEKMGTITEDMETKKKLLM
jgi:hypothetical protein